MGSGTTTRVIHKHRLGNQPVFVRVSELTFNGQRPVAVLTWLHEGDARTPGVCIELDPAKLHPAAGRRIYLYDDVTIDPRFE